MLKVNFNRSESLWLGKIPCGDPFLYSNILHFKLRATEENSYMVMCVKIEDHKMVVVHLHTDVLVKTPDDVRIEVFSDACEGNG